MSERDDLTGLELANRSVEYWFKRYSDRARKAMAIANRDAKQAGQKKITPANVLFGLLAQPDSVACHVLTECGVEPDTILKQMNRLREIPDEKDNVRLPAAEATHRLVNDSIRVCIANRHNGVGTEHLLVGLSRCVVPEMLAVFKENKLDDTKLNETAIRLLAGARDQRAMCWPKTAWAFFIATLTGLVLAWAGVVLAYSLAYRGLDSWRPTVGDLIPKIGIVWCITVLVAFPSVVFIQSKRSQFGACVLISLTIATLAGLWFFIQTIVGFGAV